VVLKLIDKVHYLPVLVVVVGVAVVLLTLLSSLVE
jgi:hypothetical protein